MFVPIEIPIYIHDAKLVNAMKRIEWSRGILARRPVPNCAFAAAQLSWWSSNPRRHRLPTNV